jgi:hypothetical protein
MEPNESAGLPEHCDNRQDPDQPGRDDRLIAFGTVAMSFVCFLTLMSTGTEPHEALMLTLALAASMTRISRGGPDNSAGPLGWR